MGTMKKKWPDGKLPGTDVFKPVVLGAINNSARFLCLRVWIWVIDQCLDLNGKSHDHSTKERKLARGPFCHFQMVQAHTPAWPPCSAERSSPPLPCWVFRMAGDPCSAPALLWCHLQAVWGKCLSLPCLRPSLHSLELGQKSFRARKQGLWGGQEPGREAQFMESEGSSWNQQSQVPPLSTHPCPAYIYVQKAEA